MSTEDEFDDELDSENEDEFTSGGQGKRSKKNGYKISNALKVPRATTYTAQALFGALFYIQYALEPFPDFIAQNRANSQSGYQLGTGLSTRCVAMPLECISRAHLQLLEVVWHDDKQIGLIDSILRNFYIPPVIFGDFAFSKRLCRTTHEHLTAVNSLDDGTETRTCIDGKQRLTSIYRCVKPSSFCLYR